MPTKNRSNSKPYQHASRKNLMLDRPTSHGPWPNGEDDPSVADQITNWLQSMRLLESRKNLIKEIIEDVLQTNRMSDDPPNYVSHHFEPIEGDTVINNNPKCKHKGSIGKVLAVITMPEDAGKMVKYRCLNSGPHWSKGAVLKKTMDQLCPYEPTRMP
jgi:hypothetical protein